MDPVVPAPLKNAAIAQLISGIVNMFVMPTAFVMFGSICSVFTFGLGGLCSFGACILWPIGIFEVVAGVMGLTNPRGAVGIMRIASFVEIGSILGGGIVSAVIGFMVMQWLGSDETRAYLES